MFLKLIACEVIFREIAYCAARSRNQIDPEFLSQGYHDNPDVGIQRIQERINKMEPERYDGILIGYGLCNNMLNGLKATHTPLIVPRAHDCITFFLGSKENYHQHFHANPGTYYYTTGWLEHRQRGNERPERRQGAALGGDVSLETLVEKYGEDNAQFLHATLWDWTQHYSRGVFIDFDFTTHLPYKKEAQEICQKRNWQFENIKGDTTLLQNWIDGPWPQEDFLIVEPGQTIRPSYDDQIIQIEAPR